MSSVLECQEKRCLPLEFPAGCPSRDLRHFHSAQFNSIIIIIFIVVLFIILTILQAVRVFSVPGILTILCVLAVFTCNSNWSFQEESKKKKKKKKKKRKKTNSHSQEGDGLIGCGRDGEEGGFDIGRNKGGAGCWAKGGDIGDRKGGGCRS